MPPKIFCIQSSSIFEQYGGIEYYLHDVLCRATELFGEENVKTLVPIRKSSAKVPVVPYQVQKVPFSSHKYLSKLENRFNPKFFFKAVSEIKAFNPTYLLNGHVNLGPMVYMLSKFTGKPFVTCVYGVESWGNLWAQDEWSLKKADGIISISNWTRDILVKRGYDKKKIQIVHPQMHPSFESVSAKKNETSADVPFTLLTISRLSANEKYKGQDHVLYALAKLRAEGSKVNFKYIILGDGDDKKRLQELTGILGLEEVVEFRPPVQSRKELELAYREADVYVMPSRYGYWNGKWRGEGFGIVYVEAAAFGLPSIAYRCGGAMDIIEHGKSGWLVEVDNLNSLAEQIDKLSKNNSLIVETGENAKERCLSNFTSEPVREQLAGALDSFSPQSLNN